MGIVNVTPDSFAESAPLVDGARVDVDAAVARGLRLRAEGADIIDVGGESTRPGAERVAEREELARVIPVVEALAAEGLWVSVDTTRASVAAAAINAGATLVNDVSGATADPHMLPLLAESAVQCVLMHRRGESAQMYAAAHYADPVAEVCAELVERVDAAVAAGVDPARIIIDPGLGFAKQSEHNWALLRGLAQLTALGLPVLIGASRKRFLGALLADAAGNPRPESQRDAATAAISVLAAQAGVWGVRVHDVVGTADALAVWREGARGGVGEHGRTSVGSSGSSGFTSSGGTMWPAVALPSGLGEGHQATQMRTPDGVLIRIDGIRALGRHGVFDFERVQGQVFEVDVQIEMLERPGADDLAETVDYSAVAELVVAEVAGEPVQLIETLAQIIADKVLSHTGCATAEVTVHKPQAPLSMPFRDVCVTVRVCK